MALIHLRGRVAGLEGRRRPVPVRFLVDTGAVYTVLPEGVWRPLGLRPRRTAEFTLADGTAIARGVSECRFTVRGRSAVSPVVLGGPEDAPLLGAVTLETLGLMVNPLTREVLPMRLLLAAVRPGRRRGRPTQGAGEGRRRAPSIRSAHSPGAGAA